MIVVDGRASVDGLPEPAGATQPNKKGRPKPRRSMRSAAALACDGREAGGNRRGERASAGHPHARRVHVADSSGTRLAWATTNPPVQRAR